MRSMTGFGRGCAATDTWLATVEISSVNRKQAEIVVQLPRELAELESQIRKQILPHVSRGRAQVSINLERSEGSQPAIQLDRSLALAFHKAFLELEKTVGYPVLPSATDYLRQPGIFSIGSGIQPEKAWPAIAPALETALSAFSAMRETEGLHLKEDCLSRIDTLSGFCAKIAAEAPGHPARQREILTRRLRDAGLEIDSGDERIAKEIAIFADRCDISEELTRLASHFAKFREYLNSSEPTGRALDFLCQELFREFNTIGSKANDASISQTVVEAKTELEKIREQIQNVE